MEAGLNQIFLIGFEYFYTWMTPRLRAGLKRAAADAPAAVASGTPR